MQEYKSLLGTNLSEGLIESNFEVAVDHYGSLHIIVVTLETLLLLCLQPGSSFVCSLSRPSSLFLFLSYSMSSFFHSVSSFWRMHRYYFPMRPFVSLSEGFDLALATEDSLPKTTVPLLISCLVCADRRSAIFYM